MPSSRGSSRPGDQTHISCISCSAVGFFTTGKAQTDVYLTFNALFVSGVQQVIRIHMYMCIHVHVCVCVFFSESFPLQAMTRNWMQFPVLCGRTLVLLYFICRLVYLLAPNSQGVPPLLSPLVATSLFPMSVSQYVFYKYVPLYRVLDST